MILHKLNWIYVNWLSELIVVAFTLKYTWTTDSILEYI